MVVCCPLTDGSLKNSPFVKELGLCIWNSGKEGELQWQHKKVQSHEEGVQTTKEMSHGLSKRLSFCKSVDQW